MFSSCCQWSAHVEAVQLSASASVHQANACTQKVPGWACTDRARLQPPHAPLRSRPGRPSRHATPLCPRPAALALAAQQAVKEGHEGATAEGGPWLFTLDMPSYFPVMTHAKNRWAGGRSCLAGCPAVLLRWLRASLPRWLAG